MYFRENYKRLPSILRVSDEEMKKKTVSAIAFLFVLLFSTLTAALHFGTVQASTNFNGIISSDTTWTKANSPYVFSGPVAVNNGVTLTIEAGTTVNMGSYYLQVNGTLNARGNNDDKIYFSGRIIFTSSSSNWNELTATGCIIEHAVLSAPVEINNASPKINNNSFTNTNSLYFIISVSEGSPIISNNILTDSGISSGGYVGSPTILNNTIINGEVAFSGEGSPIISNNTVTRGGVVDGFGIGVLGNNNAFVSGNIISGCQKGILISGSPTVQRNLIINNDLGIVVNPAATPLIQNNTITNSSVGIKLRSLPAVIVYNNIQDYGQNSIYLDGTSSNIDATYNWWGTTDASSINRTIYDFKNDFNLGTVNFVPFLTEPNPQAPTIPTLSPSPTSTSAPTQIPTNTISPSPNTTATPTQTPTPSQSSPPNQSPTTSSSPAQNSTAPPATPQGWFSGTVIAIITALIVIIALLVAILAVVLRKRR